MFDKSKNSIAAAARRSVLPTCLWVLALVAPSPWLVANAILSDRLTSLESFADRLAWVAWLTAIAFATGVMVYRRWNADLRLPDRVWQSLAICVATAMMISDIILGSGILPAHGWLLSYGWSISFLVFLSIHRNRETGDRLFEFWPLCLLMLRFPTSWEMAFQNGVSQLTMSWTGYLLDLASIPFRTNEGSLQSINGTCSIDDVLFHDLPWVWLLGFGFVYLCWRQRTIVHLPIHIASLFFWTISSQSMELWWMAWSHSQVSNTGFPAGYELTARLLFKGLAFLLFVSTEQFWLVLFSRIPNEEQGHIEKNPFVSAWNSFWTTHSSSRSKSSHKEKKSRANEADAMASKSRWQWTKRLKWSLDPRNWAVWMITFMFRWLASRDISSMTAALPSILIGLLGLPIALAACFRKDKNDRAQRYEQLLTKSMAEGKWNLSELAIQVLLDSNPRQLDYRFTSATIKERRGFERLARSEIESLATEHGHGLSAAWIIGRDFDLQSLKDWPKDMHFRFRQWMEIALEDLKDDNLLSAKTLMFSYLTEVGAYHEASRFIADVVPHQPELGLAAATLYRFLQKPDDAKRYLSTAKRHYQLILMTHVDDIDARIHLSQALMLDDEFEAAAELLNDGFSLTEDPRLAHLCGEALCAWAQRLESGPRAEIQRLKRLQILHAAVKIAPDNQLVTDALIAILAECRQSDDQAIHEAYRSLLEMSPPFVSHFIRGTHALLDEHHSDAVHWLGLAMEIQPNNASVWNNLAMALMNSKAPEFDRAFQLAERAVAKHPKVPAFLETKGQVLLRLERWLEAIKELEQIVGISEYQESATRGLAIAYRKIGNQEMSIVFEKKLDDLMLSSRPK